MLYPDETLAHMADFYAGHGVVHLPGVDPANVPVGMPPRSQYFPQV